MTRKFNKLALASVFLVSTVEANTKFNPGWEFTLNVSGGFVKQQSQTSTSNDNQITDSLDSKGAETSSTIVYPLARIQYTFPDHKNQLYLGNSSDQVSTAQFQYELGYVHKFDTLGTLTVAYFPELPFLNETWSDPYAVGKEREVTEENAQGARMAWNRFLGLPFTLKYAYAASEVKDEQSGMDFGLSEINTQSLDRDSEYNQIQLETFFPVAKGFFLRPSIQYTNRDAIGESISSDSYTGQLGLLHFRDRHTFITTFEYTAQKSKEVNPIFIETQEVGKWGAFFIYDFSRPFGWKNASFNALAGYSNSDSNIDFYDSNTVIASLGVTYKF